MMKNDKGLLVKFPFKSRKNPAKPEPERKSPRYQHPDGYTFPQRLWEVLLDLKDREETEIVTLHLPKHQLYTLAWLALTSDRRKESQQPLTDREWFDMDDEHLMLAARRAVSVIIKAQYTAEISALKNGEHPFLRPDY